MFYVALLDPEAHRFADLTQGLLAMSPQEKWSGMRQFGPSAWGGNQWYVILFSIIVIVLVALLFKFSYNRLQEEKVRAEERFLQNVRQCHLSIREYHILREVYAKSGLRHHDAIFKDIKAFERGAALVLADHAAEQGQETRVQAELEFLREKLGFTGLEISEPELPRRPETQSQGVDRHEATTRDIPLDQALTITRRLGRTSNELRATVVDNTETSLTVTLETPIKVTFGELWRAHYHFGASVWEFDTTVVSFDGHRLVLKHSDEVRVINRRRFARVPAHNVAFISKFPFTKEIDTDFLKGWKPVEFVPAVVTELAGPGLRVEASIDVSINERILVVFRLEQTPTEIHDADDTSGSRIIEDIGIVRRVEPQGDTRSIGIELIGLSDADIDELVKVTNLGAVVSKKERQEQPQAEAPEDTPVLAQVAAEEQ